MLTIILRGGMGNASRSKGIWLEDLYPEPSQLMPGQEWVENWKANVVNEDEVKKQKLSASTSNKQPPEEAADIPKTGTQKNKGCSYRQMFQIQVCTYMLYR